MNNENYNNNIHRAGNVGLANRLASTDTDRKDFNEPLKTYIACVYTVLCILYIIMFILVYTSIAWIEI